MLVVRFHDPGVEMPSVVPDREFRVRSVSPGTAMTAESRTFTLARVLFFVMLFGAPLAFGAVQPWAWATLAVICFLALSLWAVGCVQQGQLRVSCSPLYLLGLAFLLLGLLQYFGRLTFDRIGTRDSLLKLAVDLLFFFLALQLVGSAPERTRQRVGLAVAIYAFLLSLEAIIQHFSSPDRIYWAVATPANSWSFGPYVNHNHYAGLMEMLIPLSVGYWLARRKSDPLRAVLGFALLLTYCFGAPLCLPRRPDRAGGGMRSAFARALETLLEPADGGPSAQR